jgi:hypothetical protein
MAFWLGILNGESVDLNCIIQKDTNENESVYFVAKGSLSLCQLAGGEDLLALIAKRQLSLLWQFDLKRLCSSSTPKNGSHKLISHLVVGISLVEIEMGNAFQSPWILGTMQILRQGSYRRRPLK